MSKLAQLLETHSEELIARWKRAVRAGLAVPEPVSDEELSDTLPDCLCQLVAMLRAGVGDKHSQSGRTQIAKEHGDQRYRMNFSLEALVREYGVLRGVVFDLIEESELEFELDELRALDDFIATGIADGLRQFLQYQKADAAAEVEAERERFNVLFNHVPAIMAVLRGPDLRYDFANIAYHQMLGNRTLLGKAPAEAIPEVDGAEYTRLVRTVFETGEPYVGRETRVLLRQADGSMREFYFDFIFEPTRGRNGAVEGVLIHGVDVTEPVLARRAEEATRHKFERQASLLEATLRAIPDAVFGGDASGLTYANQGACELLGLTSLPLPCGDFAAIWGPLNVRHADTGLPVGQEGTTFARALRGETSTRELIFHHRARDVDLVLRSSAAPVLEDGKIIGAVVVNIDITAQKRLDDERKKRELFEQQLIGIVSHDLRNPLSAILLASSMLLSQSTLDERTRKGVGRIRSSAHRAARLISDVLDFTQARLKGSLPIHPVELDFHAQVQRGVEELQLGHPNRDITLARLGDGRGKWDPDRLSQVVGNLVGNALRYSPAGSRVTVTSIGEDDSVVLEVHNHGSPIAPEQLPGLFEAIRRGVHERVSPDRGVGLGLYIVNQIVKAHGGELTVASSQAEGTSFRVRLNRRTRA